MSVQLSANDAPRGEAAADREQGHGAGSVADESELEPDHGFPATRVVAARSVASAASGVEEDAFVFLGMRHVNPYQWVHAVRVKARWVGVALEEAMLVEFRSTQAESLALALEQGRLTVSGRREPLTYRLRLVDTIEHVMHHRHEPPVRAARIAVVPCRREELPLSPADASAAAALATAVGDDEAARPRDSPPAARYFPSFDLVVAADKPASMPVHPGGVWNKNSLLYQLQQRLVRDGVCDASAAAELSPLHRIDRVTSGLVLFSRTARASKEFHAATGLAMRCEKVYLARVAGLYPPPLDGDTEDTARGGVVVIDAPIAVIQRRPGLMAVRPESEGGKPSRTEVRRLSYDGFTSLLECRPLTGRTHQIRVHLQHVGHPIVNDPMYGGRMFASNSLSITRELRAAGLGDASSTDGAPTHSHPVVRQVLTTLAELGADSDCAQCRAGATWLPPDRPVCVQIWLHSLRYRGVGWCFETKPPVWACDGFDSRAACAEPIERPAHAAREAGDAAGLALDDDDGM